MIKRATKYRVISFARGQAFHIVDETGLPIYDGALYGNDKPIIWHDEDEVQDICDRWNNAEDESDLL